MGEQIKAINKYYTDLEYHFIDKEQAALAIFDLAEEIRKKDKNLSDRFFETATIIETNLFLFAPICKHIDVITTLIKYLNNYGAQFMFNQDYEKTEYPYKEHYIPMSLMLTVFSMCKEEAIIIFLHRAIIMNKNSVLTNSVLTMSNIVFYFAKIMINDEEKNDNEIILLEDSDLYAVINSLMIIDHSCLSQIWIQEPIKQKFLMLAEKYLKSLKCPISIFRSQQELFTFSTPHKSIMSIRSIWSEDIVAAKNLASCLDGDILFINTYMDFNGSLLVPIARLIDNLMDHAIMKSIEKSNIHIFDVPLSNNIKYSMKSFSEYSLPIYNLFYGGMWQKPVEDMYWKHNDKIFASATNEDIRRCVKSAEEGFEIWHTNSVASRVEILSKLIEALAYSKQNLLSILVSRCIKFARLYENSSGCCTQDEKSELIITPKPKGIIILREENENTLFFRLTQSLLAGNSVIVIHNANFCNIAPYFNMFSMCEIPPGVINMLSNENITELESRLCGTQYSIYIKRFFSEGTLYEKYINSYTQLSLPKQIVHPLK